MLEMISTYELIAVSKRLPRPKRFIWDTFFGNMLYSEDEKIIIEEMLSDYDVLAPYVHPTNDPQFFDSKGARAREIKPAYVQMAHAIRQTDKVNRLPGEEIGGSLSPDNRLDRLRLNKLMMHHEMLKNRLEQMACQALLNAQYVISGENYPVDYTVDFDRDASLSPAALSGNNLWFNSSTGQVGSTATPLDDIQEMLDAVVAVDGAQINTIIVGINALKGLRKSEEVRDLLDKNTRGASMNIDLAPGVNYGASYLGELKDKGIQLWVYNNHYTNASGSKVPYFDPNKISGIDTNSYEGKTLYGAIYHNDANIPVDLFTAERALDYGKGMEIYSQSAPLVFPIRPNSSFSLTVAQ